MGRNRWSSIPGGIFVELDRSSNILHIEFDVLDGMFTVYVI